MTIAVPKSPSGFGFTVAWTKPPVVEFVNEGNTAEKAGVLPGDKKSFISIKFLNVKEIMELEIIRPEGELSTRKRQTSLRRKESFTRKGTKMVIQDSQIMSWRRERALLKLLLCEEDLLNEILAGKEHFITPLRKRCNLITPIEMDFLFVNIEEVCSVHEKYVQQLRHLTQGTEDNVGRLYQKQVDERFSVLRKYVSGLTLAKILYKYKILNKPFREFVESSRLSKEQPDLLQFIEKPFKYISDLTTQLAALLSCTAVGHRDYVCLESVVSIFRTFETEMNEMKNKCKILEDLKNIESAFDEDEPYINLETLQEKTLFTRGPKHFSLIHEDRYWLFAGYLAKVEGKHYIQYWALLLSDCLILARRTEQGVLLVLDEPVMLRSIYQVTFDVMKCDTEFRILFAVPNLHKSAEKRNQWTTWILRTPCPGVKLLWQAILTHQLSMYSTEALSQGKKTSFVHAKPSLVLRGVLPKRSSKYEESSFVIEGPRAKASYSKRSAFSDSVLTGGSETSIDESNFLLKADGTKCEKLASFKLEKDEKEGSYFSLTEAKVGPLKSHKKGVVRSKSFGNDFDDSKFPFIDLAQRNKTNEKPEVPEQAVTDVKPSVPDYESASAPGTPKTTDKLVQTDDSAESPGTGSLGKRTPKKRFPRLGTFERIKLENRKANSEDLQETKICKTRTGTSAKHRRQISSTVSKEKLLKSDSASPIQDSKEISESKESSPSVKQKPRRYFGRFWKKSTNTSGGNDRNEEVNEVTAKDSESAQKTENEIPPDDETSKQISQFPSFLMRESLFGELNGEGVRQRIIHEEKIILPYFEGSGMLGSRAEVYEIGAGKLNDQRCVNY
ncbi:hypothetical protein HNY73_000927 [Argiope bruennichi]|uniref:DH domain-containing protein n=1 Tax=Argiope bruennichi TaxID=94029 RepID=A0A8T0FZN9_ARGBR|nr:hypothetical protein HNY73_000927 [Argiope bruennichi]